jgi:hypothetical protein
VQLLRGGRRIAEFLFGDECRHREVTALKDELGLFYVGGMLCATPESLDRALRRKERTARARRQSPDNSKRTTAAGSAA